VESLVRYTELEERNLGVVRQFFGEEPGPADKSELFAEDGVWWNGLPMIPGAEGVMEHRGRDAVRNILPSQNLGRGLLPGRDVYKLETCRATDVVMLADGEYVVRQQNMTAETKRGQHYANTYCFVFRFDDNGKIAYLTEHWNTWQAHRILFDNYDVQPAQPEG
jgi:ketosteroid isomerase-like protein